MNKAGTLDSKAAVTTLKGGNCYVIATLPVTLSVLYCRRLFSLSQLV